MYVIEIKHLSPISFIIDQIHQGNLKNIATFDDKEFIFNNNKCHLLFKNH